MTLIIIIIDFFVLTHLMFTTLQMTTRNNSIYVLPIVSLSFRFVVTDRIDHDLRFSRGHLEGRIKKNLQQILMEINEILFEK